MTVLRKSDRAFWEGVLAERNEAIALLRRTEWTADMEFDYACRVCGAGHQSESYANKTSPEHNPGCELRAFLDKVS
jgi:hypothetical protein